MIFKLALKNLVQRKFRSLLAIFSVSIGSGAFILFLALSQGIENSSFDQLERSRPLNQITVRPPAQEGSILSFISNNNKLNDDDLKKIEALPNVSEIHPEIQFQNFASVEVKVLGVNFISDTMLFGLPRGFIEKDLALTTNWSKEESPYPVILPRKILDLYNLTIAQAQGLPSFKEEQLIGRQLTLYPGYSTFFPKERSKKDKLQLRIVGFSEKTNLLGLALPFDLIEELNQNPENTYLELFVETDDPALTSKVANQIEDLGYQTEYFQKNTQFIEDKLSFIRASLLSISGIIFLLSFISIISTFIATTKERIKEIGLLRALGATKRQILQLILTEGGLIGILGSSLGCLLAYLASGFIEQNIGTQIQNTSLETGQLINFTPNLVILGIFLGTFISLVASYLPAFQASRLKPIEALKS